MDNLYENKSKLDEDQAILQQYNNEMKNIEDNCNFLKDKADNCNKIKENTQISLETNQLKLNRSKILLVSLQDEQLRWKLEVENLCEQKEFLIGDCIIASGVLS